MRINNLLSRLSHQKRETWNYRVVQSEDGAYHMREVYYTNGVPNSWTEPVATPYDYYDDAEELRSDLEAMLRAFDRPLLTVVDGKILRSGEPQGDD